MMHPLSVLCPVDFSDSSRAALAYASAVADHFGARLIVLTVNDPLLVDAATAAGYEPSFTTDTEHELRRFSAEVLAHIPPGAKTLEFEVATGQAAQEILRRSRQHAVDLVVMGSHGRNGFRKAFFGSTTERVLRETPVPVLVTPDERPASLSLSEIASRVGRIVAPVDLTAASVYETRIAAAIAVALAVPLVLTHVLEPVFIPARLRLALPGADASRRTQVEERLAELAAMADSRVAVEPVVVSGEPAVETARLAAARGAHLIVMGLHSSGLHGPRMGTVAYRVLSLTQALVLALPPRADAADARTSDVPASDAPRQAWRQLPGELNARSI